MFTKSIISGSNYKKISDVNAEYGFLDDLIDRVICQNSTNRLYPINNIEIEFSALLKAAKDKKDLQDIVNQQIIQKELDDPLFETVKIKEIKYENGQLLFCLDKITNTTWDNILISGNFGHTSAWNYPTSSFYSALDSENNCTVFLLNIPSDSHEIDTVIKHFSSWLPIVSAIYKREQEFKKQENLRKELEKREIEIKAKEKEKEIELNMKLKSLKL